MGVAVGLAISVGTPSTAEATARTAAVAVGALICVSVRGTSIVGTDSDAAWSYLIPRANTNLSVLFQDTSILLHA